MEVLEKGWHLADTEDIEELSQFQVDYTRFKTEVEGKLKTPYAIYKAVGDVSYMRPSMIELVKKKVGSKRRRCVNLCVRGGAAMANPTVGPVRFALWTLRDEAAQRRSP